MPNVKLPYSELWITYYEDDTEEKGFYIDCIYSGSDPKMVNLYEYLNMSVIEYAEKIVEQDLELIRIHRGF